MGQRPRPGHGLQALARAATRLGRRRRAAAGPAGARRSSRRRAAGRARAGRARRPLRALLVRPQPAGPQRLHPVARRPLRLRAYRRRPARPALFRPPSREARARGPAPTTPAPGRCTRAGASRASPTSLPRPAARLPAVLVRAHATASTATTVARFDAYMSVPPVRRGHAARLRGGRKAARCASRSRRSRASICASARRPSSSSRERGAVGCGKRTFGSEVPRGAGTYTVAARRPRPRGQPGRRQRHRRGAEAQAQEAPLDSGAPMGPRTILYTGKGGVGKTSVAAATARRIAAAGHARSCSRPTRRTRSPTCSRHAVGAEPTDIGGGVWAQQVQAQDELERNWSRRPGLAGRRARRARRGADRRRGADGAARRRRALQPAPAQGARRVGRVGRDRRRLRADRRDAAAALVPGRRALVAGPASSAARARCCRRRARSRARSWTSRCRTSA